jgi:D-3-phosphoglycerate dehydrogenase / 2-oxoglutarate reductase
MKPNILVSSYYDRKVTDPELKRLEPAAQVSRADVGRRLTETELLNHLTGVRVALISDEVFNEHVFRSSPQLQMIVVDGVGVDSIDLAAATAHHVIVNNAPFVHEANGEFTVGLILAVLRKIIVADRGVRAGQWNDRAQYIGRDLKGSTLGLLGFGRNARGVAKRMAGFGVNVLAYSPPPYADEAVARELGVTLVDYDQLLAKSDILSIHVTLNEQTRGMFDAAAIARMKTGAYLINTSRGAVVDENALIIALANGKLAGAGLDVFVEEPPSVSNPLFKMDNVVVTAHVGSDSLGAFRDVFKGAVDDILLFLQGKLPTHIINTEVLNHSNFKDWRR